MDEDEQRGITVKVVPNNHDEKGSESCSSLTMGVEESIDHKKKAKDVKLDGDEDDDREMVCRICHLNCDQSPETETERGGVKTKESSLVELGCGCKDELGAAHSHCAEAWFKLKGSRICEICGETARNITSIIQEPLVVEWNDQRSYSPERHGGGWWRGQPCCNFLMACLIVAFVLPWFFRVKIV